MSYNETPLERTTVMMWIVIALTAITSFVLGFAVCQNLYTKKITTLVDVQNAELRENWKDTFRAGWDAASHDISNVKLQYDKLMNPLKYKKFDDE